MDGHYLICGTPRTGGNLLADLLTQTGQAGAPAEHLHPARVKRRCRQWGCGPDGYVAELWRRRAPGGRFAAKVHWSELQDARAGGIIHDFADLMPGPYRAVFMYRRHVVRQSISWFIAHQTGQWWDDGTTSPDGEPAYLHEAVVLFAEQVRSQNRSWEAWFDNNGVSPLRVCFEDLVEDLPGVTRAVFRHLDVSSPVPRPRLRRQRGSLNEQFLERYRAACSA